MTAPTLLEGRAWPMGAQLVDGGINFAVFSVHAQSIELCLFDARGDHEIARVALPGHTGDVRHGFLPGARAGLVYGLRADGPWRPDHGQRFNPHKLLLDPYAREIVGRHEWRDEHFDADRANPLHMDLRDNAPHALKARVIADEPVVPHTRPHTPLADTVLYELHVKGYTQRHPGVPAALRGSYAGLASDAAIAHLRRLGVTAVSLLPVHQHLDEERLVARGLVNYWGYNTIGFFAVEPRYASSASPRDEFRAMVAKLHAAGLEVILDVVYNHTAESDEAGPTLSWRGLDNTSWYRIATDDPARYDNYTGTGNTLDLREPRVLQMVMDSLRYWATTMQVDGFRFDLAPVLGRTAHGFETAAPFFHAVAQDPQLAGLKLIAEPWDLGPGGWRLGDFPRGWLEWNDRFRDGVRGYWLAHTPRGEFAQRLAGSSDFFHTRHRAPMESVNLITAHDGFTLRDLVSYNVKHNEANGEGNRDGHAVNHSWNAGVEGDTDDPDVLALRARLQRALLATLLLSQGTPMLTAGDELGHGQLGNNNPYCQDNDVTWIDWAHADEPLIAFTTRLLAVRRELSPLAPHWYTGRPDAAGFEDLVWLRSDGERLRSDDWQLAGARALAVHVRAPGKSNVPLVIITNPHADDIAFALPPGTWRAVVDSARPGADWQWRGSTPYPLAARSVALLAAESAA